MSTAYSFIGVKGVQVPTFVLQQFVVDLLLSV